MLFHALLSITFNPDAILWSIVNSCNQYIFIKSRKTRLIIFICINILQTISSSRQPFFILKYFPSPLLLSPPFLWKILREFSQTKVYSDYPHLTSWVTSDLCLFSLPFYPFQLYFCYSFFLPFSLFCFCCFVVSLIHRLFTDSHMTNTRGHRSYILIPQFIILYHLISRGGE